MPTNLTNQEEKPLRPLTADAFIAAMKGEKVTDENGAEVCFLNTKAAIPVVSISGIIITETVVLSNDEIFNYDIELNGGVFGAIQSRQSLFNKNFIINAGEFRREIELFGGSSGEDFSIYGGDFHSEIIVDKIHFNWFSIIGGRFREEFRILGGYYQKELII